jgi:hypothetical protein
MTTRQCLNRRFHRGLLSLIAVAFVLGVWHWQQWQQSEPQGRTADLILRTILFLTLAGMLRYWWRTPCQSCQEPLRWISVLWRPYQYPDSSPPCPSCGVSIDHDVTNPVGIT